MFKIKAKIRKQRAESKEQRLESREQRAEIREQSKGALIVFKLYDNNSWFCYVFGSNS